METQALKRRNDTITVVLSFHQQLSARSETEGYHVQVLAAPRGAWGGPFLPLGMNDAQIRAIRQLYRGYAERLRAGKLPTDERAAHVLRVAGGQLFEALPETVQTCLRQANASAHDHDKSMKILLDFESNARALLGLPWELLYDPEGRVFFALRGEGIVRQIRLPGAPSKPFANPKHMLGLWAAPSDITDLAARRGEGPSPGGEDSWTWICGPGSLPRLEQTLESDDFDGVHIVAHGRGGKSWSEFRLAFEADTGLTHWVSADQLATLLAAQPGLRFVYLEVCEGGAQGMNAPEANGEEESTYNDAAAALLESGVSMVAAMQESISQQTSGLVARVFYQELDKGNSPAQAMTAARRAVRVHLDDPIQWSIPVLYTQARPVETLSLGARLADWILDHVAYLSQPRHGLLLLALALAGVLSGRLASWDMGEIRDWREMGAWVATSSLLFIFGAGGMQAGQVDLVEAYLDDRGGWLKTLLSKHYSAAVWAWLWWCLIWLGWLAANWAGSGLALNVGARQAVWFLELAGLVACGYVGARQAIRQGHLFQRVGPVSISPGDVLLFVAGPLLPLVLFGMLAVTWGRLVTLAGPVVLALLVAALLVLAGLSMRRGRMGRG